MFKKNDPLVDSVRAVMKVSDFDRQIEAAVNEYFNISSKNSLPHELKESYEDRLAEAKRCVYEGLVSNIVKNTAKQVEKNAVKSTSRGGQWTSPYAGPLGVGIGAAALKKMKSDETVKEELKGKQWKLDHNKNDEVDEFDLHKVRKHGPVKKKALEEGMASRIAKGVRKGANLATAGAVGGVVGSKMSGSKGKAERDSDNYPSPPSKEEQDKIDSDWKKKMEADAERRRNMSPEERQAEVDDIIQDLDPNSERNQRKRVERGEPRIYDSSKSKSIERYEVPPMREVPSSKRQSSSKDDYTSDEINDILKQPAPIKGQIDARQGNKGRGMSSDEINNIIKGKIEEKLSKSMSAGDVISDFVHSKDPKFKGKSTKERQRMALGAYYGMHPEKSKKKRGNQMEEEALFEEIRANLEEQLVYAYENLSEEDFEYYVNSLTEEQLDILGLNEGIGSGIGKGIGKSVVKGTEHKLPQITVKQGERVGAKELEKGVGKEGTSWKKKAAIAGGTAALLGGAAYLATRAGDKGGKGGAGGEKQDPRDEPGKWGYRQYRPGTSTYKTAGKNLDTSQITNRALGGVYESTAPQIKESFEQFLRNKFLKG